MTFIHPISTRSVWSGRFSGSRLRRRLWQFCNVWHIIRHFHHWLLTMVWFWGCLCDDHVDKNWVASSPQFCASFYSTTNYLLRSHICFLFHSASKHLATKYYIPLHMVLVTPSSLKAGITALYKPNWPWVLLGESLAISFIRNHIVMPDPIPHPFHSLCTREHSIVQVRVSIYTVNSEWASECPLGEPSYYGCS